jgi:hypothetical protein
VPGGLGPGDPLLYRFSPLLFQLSFFLVPDLPSKKLADL